MMTLTFGHLVLQWLGSFQKKPFALEKQQQDSTVHDFQQVKREEYDFSIATLVNGRKFESIVSNKICFVFFSFN